MNLLEKKLDGQIIRWKPFATSTPLKPVSKNEKVKNEICPVRSTIFFPNVSEKVPHNAKNTQSKRPVRAKIKITGKNRSIAHFDISSSSSDEDDDCLVKNRPIIKIGTENSEKVKVVAVNEKFNVGVKVTKNSSGIRRKINKAEYQNSKSETQQGHENKSENGPAIPTLGLENVDSNSKNGKSLLITVSVSSENDKSLPKTSNFVQRSKKEKLVNKVRGRHEALNVNDENNGKVKNTQRLLKRKSTLKNNAAGGKKGRETKTVLTEKSANSTHQLFTDSVQEELISSLCLNMPEMDELDLSKQNCKSISKSEKNEIAKPANSNECKMKEIVDAVHKHERPKRTRQAPKQYWLVNDKPKLLKNETKSTKILRKKNAVQSEYIPDQGLDTISGKNSSATQTAPETKKVPTVTNNFYNDGIKRSESSINTKKDPLADTRHENTSAHPVFLPLKEISFFENEFGHQFGNVWSTNNFECKIFKLRPGFNFTWEKSQDSIYIGGVLIKGKMKITIQGKENVLQEGDTVLIPPQSNFHASNTSDCDSVFYYWTFNK